MSIKAAIMTEQLLLLICTSAQLQCVFLLLDRTSCPNLLFSSSFNQETKSPFIWREAEKRRAETVKGEGEINRERERKEREGGLKVGWRIKEGGEKDNFPKQQILECGWKVPYSSKYLLLGWLGNRTSNTFISKSLQ